MPSSHPHLLSPVAEFIAYHQPEKVLDVGIGIGKYGVLAREYTDVYGPHHRFYKDEWKTVIHGIEIHEKYRNPVWDVYNRVFVGNVIDIVRGGLSFAPYDVTTMIDVLEHFEKEEGKMVIKMLLGVTKHLVVSYHNCHQKDVRDNPHEDHKSKWERDDFSGYNTRLLAQDEHFGMWGLYHLQLV